MKSWLFGYFLAGGWEERHCPCLPSIRYDSCLSQGPRRNPFRTPQWDKKNSRATLLRRCEPITPKVKPRASLSVEEGL